MGDVMDSWERERLVEALDSHQRGLSGAPNLTKWLDQRLTTTTDSEDPMTFVVSTEEVDRHGDTIRVEGWHLEAYMQNPVVLGAHAYYRPAIGRATRVWKQDHQLIAKIEFAPTEFAQEVAALYRGGFQRGVSVGFRPLKYDLRRDSKTGECLGVNFAEQELLEISAAPVPANPGALRKALAAMPRIQGYYRAGGLEEGSDIEEILEVLRSAAE